MNWYTVFVRESNGTGTTHVSAHVADDIEAAKEAAIAETAVDWGDWEPEELSVLGVAEGNVSILEWDDEL